MKLVGTRDARDAATFLEAASGATPEHGGLFVPALWPRFDDIDALLALSWKQRCEKLIARWIGDELARADIAALVERAFDFGVPVVPVTDGTYALELFHGPTLAFKDFGARFLAGVLEHTRSHGTRTILTATSGDTGAAVAHAFWRKPNVRVVVLYPNQRVSPLQEKQIASLGDNVTALAVDGSFDDCQALVKSCFADRTLSIECGLTSANSINIARLLAQALYFFEAASRLRDRERLVIAVPSGNFGDLCAGLMAWKAGLRVECFVAATNANDTVPDFLDHGVYRARASVATLSNAMDVGAPSNWERIEALFGGDIDAMRSALRWGRASDDETADELRVLRDLGYAACPHTAVAHRVLTRVLRRGETGVFLATAHAAKFGEVIAPILGEAPPLPSALAAFASRPVLSRRIANDRAQVVAALRE